MGKHTVIAVDIAKSVFEIAESEEPGRVSRRRRVTRAQFLRVFTNREPVEVVMEACGSAHHWGRELQALGHTATLLPPRHTRAYRMGSKTDRTDTDAVLEARRNERIRPVPVKTLNQQSLGFLHRARTAWIHTRTQRLNAIRGILREFGVSIPVGAARVLPALRSALEAGTVPETVHPILLEFANEIRELDKRILDCQKQIQRVGKETPGVQEMRSIPGVGSLVSTALASSVVDPNRFPSGRHMAAFIGLVPQEFSSGNKRRLGSITKSGDPYPRTMLIHGARSVLIAAKKSNHNDYLRTWALNLEKRIGHNKAAVALANKIARIAWACWSKHTLYQSRPITTKAPEIS